MNNSKSCHRLYPGVASENIEPNMWQKKKKTWQFGKCVHQMERKGRDNVSSNYVTQKGWV